MNQPQFKNILAELWIQLALCSQIVTVVNFASTSKTFADKLDNRFWKMWAVKNGGIKLRPGPFHYKFALMQAKISAASGVLDLRLQIGAHNERKDQLNKYLSYYPVNAPGGCDNSLDSVTCWNVHMVPLSELTKLSPERHRVLLAAVADCNARLDILESDLMGRINIDNIRLMRPALRKVKSTAETEALRKQVNNALKTVEHIDEKINGVRLNSNYMK